MQLSKEAILSQFQPDIAHKLLEFGHTITTHECDYYLFMSRKFCCLYDLLISIGAPPVQKQIISDKILDLSFDHLENKTIRIVDDIIICGSTIWKTKNKLLNKFKVSDVKTSVFTVNEKWWAPKCGIPDYKAIVLNDERAMTFCTNVVNALSIAPRPYLTDYPLFREIEIKKKHWNRILSSKDWSAFDISTSLQLEYEVSSLTFFPTSNIYEELKEIFGKDAFNLIDILKVRVQTKNIGWGIQVTILPIVTFKPLNVEILNRLFENHLKSLSQQIPDNNILIQFNSQFLTETSKLRLLQFTAAAIIGGRFGKYIQENQERKLNLQIKNSDIEILFGFWNLELIKNILQFYLKNSNACFVSNFKGYSSNVDLEQTELKSLLEPSSNGDTIKIEPAKSKEAPRNIFADFNNIFLALHNRREIIARKNIKEASEHDDWDTIRGLDRLETGLTWPGILKYLKKIYLYRLSTDVKNALSLVLDSSIDKGIAVPVIRYTPETNLIYRAYRHGEDVQFADEEIELSGIAIKAALKAISEYSIPKVILEKILVLLIKIGSSKKFLQVQYGTSGQDGYAKIGFYLHGAITKYYQGPDFYAENNIWLSKYLEERKVIQRVEGNRYKFNENIPAVQPNPNSAVEAEKFGLIIGTLIKGIKDKSGNDIRLNQNDLILLSTCWRLRDVAAALYTELLIFRKNLFPLISNYIDLYKKNMKKNPVPILEAVLRSKGCIALNSLHFKYKGWLKEEAKNIVEKGVKILYSLNQEITALEWKAYWLSQDIFFRHDEEQKFSNFVLKMAKVGHRLLFYTNLFEIFLRINIAFNIKNKVEQNQKFNVSIEKLKDFYNRTIALNRELFSQEESKAFNRIIDLYESIFRDYNPDKLIYHIWRNLKLNNDKLINLLERIEIELKLFEMRGDCIYYRYMFYYDIIDSTASKRKEEGKEIYQYRKRVIHIKNAINSFIRRMEKEANIEKEEIYCVNGDSTSTNDSKYVFFTGRLEGYSLRRLYKFIENIYNLSDEDIHFRSIVLPCNIFNSPVFRLFHNVEVDGTNFWENLSRALKEFKKLEEKFNDGKNLLFILDSDLTEKIKNKLPHYHKKAWKGTIETEIAGNKISTKSELWCF